MPRMLHDIPQQTGTKMSKKAKNKGLILDVLQTAGKPLYGYEIMCAVRDNHSVKILIGSLYVAISELLDENLIEESEPHQRDPEERTYYKPTRRGHRKRVEKSQKSGWLATLGIG